MPVQYRYSSLEDFLISKPLTADGSLDDGWGASFPIKGREISATVLFADIPSFTARTQDLSSTETLAFVNNFFAWISAEALQGRPCLIDKYIGDEIMVVFSNEFGGEDAFGEALAAARWMGENDALDFAPQIGLASGQVTVGYVGTPLKYGCSVFGRPVALAARCAKLRPPDGYPMFSTRIAFPAAEWEGRTFEAQFSPVIYKGPEGQDIPRAMTWQMMPPREAELKNMGSPQVVEVINTALRLVGFSAEERARTSVELMRQAGQYRPDASGQ